MGVNIVVTPETQIAVVLTRNAKIAEKFPALNCVAVEYRDDGRFYLKFGVAVAGVGATAEHAVVAAVLTFERLGHIPWVPSDVIPALPIWVRKIVRVG